MHGRRLTDDLADLLRHSDGRGLSIRDILDRVGERATALLMVLCSAPFLLPASIPGTSTPFGVGLVILGILMARQRPPWVPARIGRLSLSHPTLEKMVAVLLKVFGRIERFLRPRWSGLADSPLARRGHGLYLVFMALVLAVPFPPVPFVGSNAIAAWPIFVVGLGMLERDGKFIAAGYALFVPFVAYWVFMGAALWTLGVQLFTWFQGTVLWAWLMGLFQGGA